MITWKERSSQVPKPQGNFPDLIARILHSRGVEQDGLDILLNPKLSQLRDPFLMSGMKEAVERLIHAFKNKESICVYADFDLDGTSGLAILKRGLEKIGFENVFIYQPKRLSEGYGFHADAVEELQNLGVKVIITVDVGITSHKACTRAKELGVDVILTDHHLPSDELPQAYVIVNPNQKSCRSELGYLCGAGVAFYLLRALKRAFFDDPQLPKHDWDLKEVLDYFCIGTLTDMVPLIGDNRVLVKHGLIALSQTSKAGLKALLGALKLDGRELSSQDVAIRFAPKLNALSRMESEILPIQIYLEDDKVRANQMIHKVLENNETRQILQGDAEQRALELLKDWKNPDFVFVSSPFFHRGVIGLIATKLSQIYNRPAFVGSENSEGVIVGSSRLTATSEHSLVDALRFAERTLNRHGGHAAAAGFELHTKDLKEFVELLTEYFITMKHAPQPVELNFDTTATLDEIDSSTMKWHEFLGPYGVGFNVPVICLPEVELVSKKEIKGGHLKLVLSQSNKNTKIEALFFSPPTHCRLDNLTGSKFSVLGELQWNYFAGKKSIQLLVKDIKSI